MLKIIKKPSTAGALNNPILPVRILTHIRPMRIVVIVTIFTMIFTVCLNASGASRKHAPLLIESPDSINVTAEVPPVVIDSVILIPDTMPGRMLELLKQHRLVLDKEKIAYLKNRQYPKFIQFCINTYRWFNRTFNTQDSTYVVSTGKHGRVTLYNDNWLAYFQFEPSELPVLHVVGDIYSSIGLRVNYSGIGLGYSVDVDNIFKKKSANHKRLDFSFNTARFLVEAFYWDVSGKTTIRRYGELGDDSNHRLKEPYEGLSFKAAGASAIYFFNYKKYSYSAAYSLSRRQLKSAGTWALGADFTFYSVGLDFDKFPELIQEVNDYPFRHYRLRYASYELMGGYSQNVVINKHFLWNVTMFPSIGVSVSHEGSTVGRKTLFSGSMLGKTGITYCTRSFFAAFEFNARLNLFKTEDVGFNTTFMNFGFSTGVRF